ncbi:MAG: nuclear transport factor 2 family protein [Georgfuchsia sp.]
MSQSDTEAIIQVINLYALGIDTQRWELFDLVFTPDMRCDYGPTSIWQDLETFKRDFEAFHDPFDGTQHVMTNHLVKVDGDKACATTYGHWRLIRKCLDGGDFWEGNGWYDDKLVKTSAGWRIRERTCRIIWWGGNPQAQETIPGVKFVLQTTNLRREAKAGAVPLLDALVKK